jgi:tetratricopeptide (TPR) repeat protein
MEGRTCLCATFACTLLLTGCATGPTVKTGPLTVGARSTSSTPPPAEAPPPTAKTVTKKVKDAPKRSASPALEVSLAEIQEDAALKKKKDEPETCIRLLDEARQQYQRVLKMDPDNVKAQEGLVRVYTQMGEHHKAQEILRKKLASTPQDSRLWVELGMSCNRQKNYDEALRCFRKALEIDPESKQFMKVTGYTLVWMGRVNEGVPYLTRSLGAAPAHYNVAGILMRQNQMDEARRHLQLALDANPEFDRAKDMLTRLREGTGAAPATAGAAGAPEAFPALGFAPVD